MREQEITDDRPVNGQQRLLAAVDLGSNSFRLVIAGVEGGPGGHQLRVVDQIKETVRLGSGLDRRQELSQPAQQRALDALSRLAERIRDFEHDRVRAVATNTFRVARNAAAFLEQASRTLGYPIEVIAGREEARLIYLGASQDLPVDGKRRMLVDIGGGSTECIIGVDFEPLRRESLQMGCVSITRDFFADGRVNRQTLRAARIHCAERIAAEVRAFRRLGWEYAVGTSGTAKSLASISDAMGGSPILTQSALAEIEKAILEAGSLETLELPGLKPDRRGVIAGGLAVMQALFEEFRIESLEFCESALREGLLHDLLGRGSSADRREVTISHWVERYRLDPQHGDEVANVAESLYRQLQGESVDGHRLQLLRWAARIREVGASIAHADAHKHGAYIIANADMPGFSGDEQKLLSLLVLGQTGGLRKLQAYAPPPEVWSMILALRLAVILQRRRDGRPTPIQLRAVKAGAMAASGGWKLELPAAWVAEHALTDQTLQAETREWREAGPVRVASYRVV